MYNYKDYLIFIQAKWTDYSNICIQIINF